MRFLEEKEKKEQKIESSRGRKNEKSKKSRAIDGSMMKLRFIKPDDPSAVTFSEEERNEGAEQWKHSLVGYTVGAKPGFMSISKYVSNAWKEFQLPKVYQLKDGVYPFKFDIEEAMKEVLERRWTVFEKFPLVLQQWSPYLDINELPSGKAPVWIQLAILIHMFGLLKMV